MIFLKKLIKGVLHNKMLTGDFVDVDELRMFLNGFFFKEGLEKSMIKTKM